MDWLTTVIRPIIERLKPGGSLCLNIGVDVFERGGPSRSLYPERLTLRLVDMGLSLVDRLIWKNASAPPGPVQWTCKHRVQLVGTYEYVLWFAKSVEHLRSDNRRVLQPHSARQRRLIEKGGEKRDGVYADGSHRITNGSFGNDTPGRIPRNVLEFSHTCASKAAYRRKARALGLPVHGAAFPASMIEFLVSFMSEEGDLVVDPMAGSFTVAECAEKLRRRWLATEVIAEYVAGGAARFNKPIDHLRL